VNLQRDVAQLRVGHGFYVYIMFGFHEDRHRNGLRPAFPKEWFRISKPSRVFLRLAAMDQAGYRLHSVFLAKKFEGCADRITDEVRVTIGHRRACCLLLARPITFPRLLRPSLYRSIPNESADQARFWEEAGIAAWRDWAHMGFRWCWRGSGEIGAGDPAERQTVCCMI